MIRGIIDEINQRFDYTFKDVLLGVVHPHSNKGKVIPVTSDGVSHPEAVPDSARKSIVYWEDYGASTWRQTVRYRFVNHELRLLVWLNFDKIQIGYQECVGEIYRNLPRRIGNILVSPAGEVPKSTDLFARYDYQQRKQFITYPYDAFGITVLVKYPQLPCP